MAYLCSLRKPGKMSPNTFLLKLKAANRLVKSLPGAPDTNAGFSEEQLKRQFLKAMPNSWIDKFHDANMSLKKTSLVDIKWYMDRQNLKDPYANKKDKEQNCTNNDQNFSRNNQHGSNNRHGNCGGSSNRDGNGNNRNSNANGHPAHIQLTDPCLLPGHGNHTWGQCNSNINNPQAKSSKCSYQSK
mmetsp:Transcript_3269/g.5018  ORF Transcript_3269/g.5018 Transcript_3269/m.5018 type:complete len:186 (-) Transcript_3269:558-1115(-)